MQIKYLLANLQSAAKKAESVNISFFKKLKSKKKLNLDYDVQDIHDQVFDEIDCLECANCCRTLGPRLIDRDIERLSKYLNISTVLFIEKYLIIDEDNDYVFKSMPCPFLDYNNYCLVYENRPHACSEYPHTNRRKFIRILDLTLKNTFTCPAVFLIVEELKKKYK